MPSQHRHYSGPLGPDVTWRRKMEKKLAQDHKNKNTIMKINQKYGSLSAFANMGWKHSIEKSDAWGSHKVELRHKIEHIDLVIKTVADIAALELTDVEQLKQLKTIMAKIVQLQKMKTEYELLYPRSS
jgi:hypothetical protein